MAFGSFGVVLVGLLLASVPQGAHAQAAGDDAAAPWELPPEDDDGAPVAAPAAAPAATAPEAEAALLWGRPFRALSILSAFSVGMALGGIVLGAVLTAGPVLLVAATYLIRASASGPAGFADPLASTAFAALWFTPAIAVGGAVLGYVAGRALFPWVAPAESPRGEPGLRARGTRALVCNGVDVGLHAAAVVGLGALAAATAGFSAGLLLVGGAFFATAAPSGGGAPNPTYLALGMSFYIGGFVGLIMTGGGLVLLSPAALMAVALVTPAVGMLAEERLHLTALTSPDAPTLASRMATAP